MWHLVSCPQPTGYLPAGFSRELERTLPKAVWDDLSVRIADAPRPVHRFLKYIALRCAPWLDHAPQPMCNDK
jgi:hypothetical protein